MAHISDEIKAVLCPETLFEEKQRLIIQAGEAGCISNLIPFIGNPDVGLQLQFLVIRTIAKRERNQDLLWLLEKNCIHPLVRKTIEESLFQNVLQAAQFGCIRDIYLIMESAVVPEMVKTHAKSALPLAIDCAISKGFYLGFPELLGKSWVLQELQLKAFAHWEKGRATDLDLELLLRKKSLKEPVQKAVVDALFQRNAASRVPPKLRMRKIQENKKDQHDKKEQQGEMIRLKDFHDAKKKRTSAIRAQAAFPQIKIRRRKVI